MAIIVNARRKAPNLLQGSEPSSPYAGEVWFDSLRGGLRYRDPSRSQWLSALRLVTTGPGACYGYYLGGNTAAGDVSSIDRVSFPTLGVETTGATLPRSEELMAPANSKESLYLAGGLFETAAFSTVDRLNFPYEEGAATTVANLELELRRIEGANSSANGYFVGGYDGAAAANLSTVRRFNFAAESLTTIGNAPSGDQASTAAFNSSNHGYFVNASSVDRLWFAGDATMVTRADVLAVDSNSAAACNATDYGYVCGGAGLDGTSVVQRLGFPFDGGSAVVVGNLQFDAYYVSSCNASTFGLTNNGRTYDGTTVYHYSYLERLLFPFDSGQAEVVAYTTVAKSTTTAADGVDFVSLFV